MRVPESITERIPALEALNEDWQPVSLWALGPWAAFYVVVLLGAAGGGGIARWIDLVLIPVHEGGHLLFRFFGNEWLMVAGETAMQLFAPFALATYFALQRQILGTAFCAFFFFEQFLPIATYMADARAQALPLLTAGNSDEVIHDWNYLFSSVGLLDHDTQIAAAVRVAGWMGMLGVTGWLVWRGWPRREAAPAGAQQNESASTNRGLGSGRLPEL